MDTALPAFILGYHGCDASVVNSICDGCSCLKVSHNDYDWLADGIYFWEHNPFRAYEFACMMAKRPHPSGQKVTEPAVIGAIINLGNCLNLLDSQFIALVKTAHNNLTNALEASHQPLPRNSGGVDRVDRKLDCAVIRMLHQTRLTAGAQPFDTVRAAFFEGEPLYDGAGFASRNHIQICVRNPRQILGYFRPLDESGRPISFH